MSACVRYFGSDGTLCATHHAPFGGNARCVLATHPEPTPSRYTDMQGVVHMKQSANGCVNCDRRWNEHHPEPTPESVERPRVCECGHPESRHYWTCDVCGHVPPYTAPAPTAPAGLREAYLRGYDDGRADRAILNDAALASPSEEPGLPEQVSDHLRAEANAGRLPVSADRIYSGRPSEEPGLDVERLAQAINNVGLGFRAYAAVIADEYARLAKEPGS